MQCRTGVHDRVVGFSYIAPLARGSIAYAGLIVAENSETANVATIERLNTFQRDGNVGLGHLEEGGGTRFPGSPRGKVTFPRFLEPSGM